MTFLTGITKNIFLITAALTISSCAYLQENLRDAPAPEPVKPQLSDREKMFNRAEAAFKNKEDSHAVPMYLYIVREPAEGADSIYENSLLNLGRIYERSDQSEKAILAFEELLKTNSKVISTTSLRMLIIKNHFRVSNYYQAKSIRADIDADYKQQKIDLHSLFEALYYNTDMYYDRHVMDELLFVGEIQKFFVYVIESELVSDSEKATELLILYYKKFVSLLDNRLMPLETKKSLTITIINQLNKFERYKMEGEDKRLTNFNRFSNFAKETQQKLTERMTNGKL